jgi:predicted hotdog family 3-hydroxylacyl-ACP dehydratase
MLLNRAWIEARIPHQGRMCLLDEVLDWNAQHIRCRTATHRAPDNPLRSHDRLGIACGIEYAAQAMALHGALAHGVANDTANDLVNDASHHAANDAANNEVDDSVNEPANDLASATAGRSSRVGLLASVRDVRFFVPRLDDIESDLICEAIHLAGDSITAMYEFALRDQDRRLLSGRASVVLDAGGRRRT